MSGFTRGIPSEREEARGSKPKGFGRASQRTACRASSHVVFVPRTASPFTSHLRGINILISFTPFGDTTTLPCATRQPTAFSAPTGKPEHSAISNLESERHPGLVSWSGETVPRASPRARQGRLAMLRWDAVQTSNGFGLNPTGKGRRFGMRPLPTSVSDKF